MGTINQRIPHLLDGISQLPVLMRKPSEVDDMANCLPIPGRGLAKRTGTRLVGSIPGLTSTSKVDSVIPVTISGERLWVVLANGLIRLYREATDSWITPSTPDGSTYLGLAGTGVVNPQTDYTIVASEIIGRRAGGDINTGSPLSGSPAYTWLENGTWSAITTSSLGPTVRSINNAGTGVGNGDLVVTQALSDDNFEVACEVLRINAGFFRAGLTFWIADPDNPTTLDSYKLLLEANGGSAPAWGITAKIHRRLAGTSNVANETTYAIGTVNLILDPTTPRRFGVSVVNGSFQFWSEPAGGGTRTLIGGSITPDTDMRGLGRVYCGLFGDGNSQTGITRYTFSEDEVTTPAPGTDKLRTVQEKNRLFIANPDIKVRRSSTRAAAFEPQALVYISEADFGTSYSLAINGTSLSFATSTGISPEARVDIATTKIAQEILARLRAEANFSGFRFDLYGSMIHVKKTDGTDFTIATEDGLADNGLKVVKGSVQRTADLPERCLGGFILEVKGDPESDRDNYWVRFNDDGTPSRRGIWEESAKPGVQITVDPSTMPHELVVSSLAVENVENIAATLLPDTQDENRQNFSAPWNTSINGTGSGGDAATSLSEHLEDSFVNLTNATGSQMEVSVIFDASTITLAEPYAVLEFHVNDGPSGGIWTLVHSVRLNQGLSLYRQKATFLVTAGANFDIRARLTYPTLGSTPGMVQRAFVRLYTDTFSGFIYSSATGKRLVFREKEKYPQGTQWTVTVNGTPVNYTQTGDQTGAQVATSLTPLIDALATITATNPSPGAIIVTDSSGFPTVIVARTFPTTTTFWNPDLNLVPSDLIGLTLTNQSDGSQGTVVSNTATRVVVTTLTGGTANSFQDRDEVSVSGGPLSAVFRRVKWSDREAGDLVTNPWPAFVDEKISELFWHRGRLGFCSPGAVSLSEVSKPENLFRTATAVLLESDPIGVTHAGKERPTFHYATSWNDALLLWSSRSQYILEGEPALTPLTASLRQFTEFRCDANVKPVVAGRYVFFTNTSGQYARLNLFGIFGQEAVQDAADLGKHIPTLLSGTPHGLVVDADYGLALLKLGTSTTSLWCLRYSFEEDTALRSWGRWDFTTPVLAVGVDAGILALVTQNVSGTYLELLNFQEPTKLGDYTDRHTTTPGISFEAYVDLSAFRVRTADTTGIPRGETQGRLQLSFADVLFEDSGAFSGRVSWTDVSRDPVTYPQAGGTGQASVPLLGNNELVRLRLSDNTATSRMLITGIDWEGKFHRSRSRRV